MPDSALKQAQALSISHVDGSQHHVIGIVLRNEQEGISLELLGEFLPLAFNEGDLLTVKFWDDRGMYTGRSQILDTFGPRGILISQPDGIVIEKRRFPRYSAVVQVSFAVIYSPERRVMARKVYPTETKDLSAGGAEFETSFELKNGEILSLELHFSDTEIVNVMARVVRSQPAGRFVLTSVQFIALRPEDYDRVQKFLVECATNSAED